MEDKPKLKCWARRHMTPSQYVTYDAMRHLRGRAPNPPICYATILKIANNSNLGRATTINNIQALLRLGWLIPAPDAFERWNNSGRWASKQYLVRDDVHDHCADCPPFKYDLETGDNLEPAEQESHLPTMSRVLDTDHV